MANGGKEVFLTEDGYFIDPKTGEYMEGVYGKFKSYDQLAQQKKYIESLEEKRRGKAEKNLSYKKFGGYFIWQYFSEQEKLFPDLRPQDVARLVLIATYCGYETDKLFFKRTPMSKNNMSAILNVGETRFKKWFAEMVEKGYLFVKDGFIRINKNYFGVGELLGENSATRLFVSVYRNLYNNVCAKDHYKIGYVLRLIPYLSPYFNVLVKNPWERDENLLNRLKMSDLADILGVSKKNIRRLANELLSLSYGEERKPIIGLVAFRSLDVNNMFVILNTNLVFGGNFEEYKKIEDLFDDRFLEIGECDIE